MGVGVIIRDHEENVMAFMYSLKQFIIDLIVVEAFTAQKTVKFNRDLDMWDIICERDALEIVTALQKEGQSWNSYNQLIKDTKVLLHNFKFWNVQYQEGCNMAAHRIAKGAIQ